MSFLILKKNTAVCLKESIRRRCSIFTIIAVLFCSSAHAQPCSGISGTISPAAASFCAGGSRLLQVSGTIGTSYQWYKNDTLIAGATANNHPATTSGTYTVDIIVGTCQVKASNSSVITVTPLPTGSISPASAALCPGSTVLLSTSGGTSYEWFRNGVSQVSPSASPTFTVTQPGTYAVAITSGTCTNSATNSVLITQGVAPSGFISPASAVLCPGGQVPLIVTTAGGVNTYQWFKDGQFLNNVSGATFNATQPGIYSVIIATNSGCNGSATNMTSITQGNPITFTITSTNPSCASTTGSILVSGVTGGGSTNYRYSNDNGATYQTAGTFNNLAAGTYQIVVRDTSGCASTPRPIVIQSFSSTLSGTANTTNARCGGATGSAIINAAGGTSPYAYKLDSGSYQTSNSFPGLTAGSHIVTVKDVPGCVFDVVFVISQSTPNPNLVITNPPVICPGYSTNLQAGAITAGSDTGLTFTYWKDTTAITPLPNPGAATDGTYYIKASNGAGCFTIKPVTVSLQLTCLPESSVFVPTAFTPYKNGANDVLRPILYNIIELRYFKVFNRWGQEVYKTSVINDGWDGTIKGSRQPSEAYVWIVECIGKNGEVIKLSGRSLLIR